MIAEAKTAGLIAPPSYITEFGEEDTDELPEWILAQCHHQLAVVRSQPGLENTKVVLVPALIIRRGFVLYRIEYSEAWERQLIETETRFWNEYVLKNERPPDSVPHLDNLKQLSRQPNKIVDIDPRLVARWDKCRLARLETLKRLKAAEEHAAAEVVMALDDAEGGVFSGDDGPGMVTFFEYHRRGYPVKPTSYRSLKLKGVK
jgi:predicted phage-related endonuclease